PAAESVVAPVRSDEVPVEPVPADQAPANLAPADAVRNDTEPLEPAPQQDLVPASIADMTEDRGAPPAPTVESFAPGSDKAAPTPPVAAEAETLAATEPSPESALPLDVPEIQSEALASGVGLADDVSMTASGTPLDVALESGLDEKLDALSDDPAFDAMLEEFVGASTGPIVEQRDEPSAAALPDEVSPAESFTAEPPRADETAPRTPMPLGGVPAPLAMSATAAAQSRWDEPLGAEALDEPIDHPLENPLDNPLDLPPAPAQEATSHDATAQDVTAQDVTASLSPPPLPAPTHAPAPAAEATAQKPSGPSTPPPLAPRFDPFMGMGRDQGSFIGGLPLNLPAADPFAFGSPELPPPIAEPEAFRPQLPGFAPPPLPPAVPPSRARSYDAPPTFGVAGEPQPKLPELPPEAELDPIL